jgi:hypothetical protein
MRHEEARGISFQAMEEPRGKTGAAVSTEEDDAMEHRRRLAERIIDRNRHPRPGADEFWEEWKERLESLRGKRSAPDLFEILMEIGRRCSSLPDLDTRSADEILGYDGMGS